MKRVPKCGGCGKRADHKGYWRDTRFGDGHRTIKDHVRCGPCVRREESYYNPLRSEVRALRRSVRQMRRTFRIGLHDRGTGKGPQGLTGADCSFALYGESPPKKVLALFALRKDRRGA